MSRSRKSDLFTHSYTVGSHDDPSVRFARVSAIGEKPRSSYAYSGKLSARLRDLLSPLSQEKFQSQTLGKTFLIGRGKDPRRFDRYLDLPAFKALIVQRAVPEPCLHVYGKDRKLVPAEELRSPGFGPLYGDSDASLLDPEKVIRRICFEKASVKLWDMACYVPRIAELAHDVGAWTGHDVFINAYYTPARSQTYGWHWDNHDSFILQTHGEKQWHIFEPGIPLPPTGSHFKRWAEFQQRDSRLLKKVVLKKGDFLYLPAGFPHFAKALGSDSLHLTVGVSSASWFDVLKDQALDSLSLAADEMGFRQRVGHVPFESLNARDVKRLQDEFGRTPSRELREIHAIRAVLNSRLDLQSLQHLWASWEDKRALTSGTVLVKTSLDWRCLRTEAESGSFKIVLPQKRVLVLPDSLWNSVHFISEHNSFTMADIPGSAPRSRKRLLVRRLIEEGMLCISRESE